MTIEQFGKRKLLLDALATYRKWRKAQQAHAQALERGDQAEIARTEQELHEAYQEYKPHG
jgi:hypothetical protein